MSTTSIIIEPNKTVVRKANGKEINLPSLKELKTNQDDFLLTLRQKGLIKDNELVGINRTTHH